MPKVIMKCPKCGAEYGLGTNFCKNCESLLEAVESEAVIPSATTIQKDKKAPEGNIIDKELVKKKEEVKEIREEIEKSLVKAVIKELLIIKDERDKYKKLLQALEEKKGTIDENSYKESKAVYENNLIEVAGRFKVLKETYAGLKEKVGSEIQSLEKKLSLIKEEISGLKKAPETGQIPKEEMRIKTKNLRDEIKYTEKNLKEKKKLQSLLAFKDKPEGFYSLTLGNGKAVATVLIAALFIIAVGYRLIKILPKKPETAFPQAVLSLREEDDISGVKELLERIRKANLNKDIELFNSCYSQDYEGFDKRKEKALTLWKNFDFIRLEYNLKESIIKQKEGTIRVGWDMEVRSRSGEVNDLKDDLTVFIIKDDNVWKIRRVIKEKA